MFASCYQPVPQIPSCILRIRIFFYDEKKECLDAKEKVAQRIQQQQKRDFYEWTRKKKQRDGGWKTRYFYTWIVKQIPFQWWNWQ